MSELSEASKAATEWALLADAVKQIANDKRDELIAAMVENGSLKQASHAGVATWTPGRPKATVTNERALLAWVREKRPDMLITMVNPAYVEALKKQCDRDGVAFDLQTGEVIPGVGLVDAPGTLRITNYTEKKQQARELAKRLADGGGPLSLEGS